MPPVTPVKMMSSSLEGGRKKARRLKRLSELNEEPEKVGICKELDQDSSYIKRKERDARTYKALFRTGKRKKTVLDVSPRMDEPSGAEVDVNQSSDSKLFTPREEEGNNFVRELANDTVASISRDVGKTELPDSSSRGSTTEGSNGNVVGETLIGNTCSGAEVSPELEIVDSVTIEASKKQDMENDGLINECQKVDGDSVNPSVEKWDNEQKSIYIYLTAEMEKLTEVLSLKEDMKHAVNVFLRYVVDNHRMSEEDTAIYQAMQISVCWIAASILNQKIDMRESLILAKEKLNFKCSDEEAEYIYNKLQMLVEVSQEQPNIVKELQALTNPTSTEGRGCNDESETKSMSMLEEKQQEEIDEFHKFWEGKRLQLEKKKAIGAAAIRNIYGQHSTGGVEKLKSLDAEFSLKLEEHKKLMDAALQDLRAKHVAARNEDRKKSAPNATVSDSTVEPVGCTSPIDSDRLQSATPVHAVVDAVACDVASETTHTVNETVDKLHANDDTLLDVCVDAAKEAEGPEVTVLERTSEVNTDDLAQCEMSAELEGQDQSNQDDLSTSMESTELEIVDQLVATHNSIAVALGVSSGAADNGVAEEHVHLVAESGFSAMETNHQAEEPTDHSQQQQQPQVGENSSPSSSSDTGNCNIDNNRHSLPPVVNQDDEPTSGLGGSPHRVGQPSEVDDGVDPLRAITNEVSECEISTEVQGEDQPNQDNLSKSTEHMESENVAQLDTNSLTLEPESGGFACQILNDGCTTLQATETTHQVEEPTNHSQQHQPQVGENLGQSSSTDTSNRNIGNNQQSQLPVLNRNVEPTNHSQEHQPQVGENLGQSSSTDTSNRNIGNNQHSRPPVLNRNVKPTNHSQQHQLQVGENLGQSSLTDTSNRNVGNNQHSQPPVLNRDVEPTNHSQQHQPQVGENLGQSSSTDTSNRDIVNNQNSQPPVLNRDILPTSGSGGSLYRVGQPFLVDNGASQRLSLFVLPPANQLGLSSSHRSSQADPLQIELEKLRKQMDQTTKGHEDLKSQMRSDYEKEIAEIRDKYQAKFQDAEAIFQLKKKAVDTNTHKVFLNKVLADAVNTKNIDFWPSGFQTQPGFMRQLEQLAFQQTHGVANVGRLSAGGTPAVQQSTSLNLPAVPRSSTHLVGGSCRPPIISSVSYPQTNARVGGGDIRAAAPHVQSVRALHLRPIVADVRSAAPHLQPCRPQVSVPPASWSSLPHNVTTQQLSMQPREPSPLQTSNTFPWIPRLPLPQPQISLSEPQRVGLTSYHSTPPSVQEMLRDIDRRLNSVLPNHSVSPVAVDPNVGPNGQPVLHAAPGGATSSVPPTDVIHLSDDE